MKSIILSALMVSTTIILSGCATKEAAPENMIHESSKPSAFAEQNLGNTVIYQGWVADPKIVPQTTLQNAAIEFKLAAQHFKSLGIKYFTLSPKHNVPFMITHFKDMAAYCYPANAGYSYNEINAAKTQLESGKCSIGANKDGPNGAQIWFIGKEDKEGLPVWSVEQVLNDEVIDQYIQTVMDTAKIPVQNRLVSVTHLKGSIIPR
jgi:hypothetical protein